MTTWYLYVDTSWYVWHPITSQIPTPTLPHLGQFTSPDHLDRLALLSPLYCLLFAMSGGRGGGFTAKHAQPFTLEEAMMLDVSTLAAGESQNLATHVSRAAEEHARTGADR